MCHLLSKIILIFDFKYWSILTIAIYYSRMHSQFNLFKYSFVLPTNKCSSRSICIFNDTQKNPSDMTWLREEKWEMKLHLLGNRNVLYNYRLTLFRDRIIYSISNVGLEINIVIFSYFCIVGLKLWWTVSAQSFRVPYRILFIDIAIIVQCENLSTYIF